MTALILDRRVALAGKRALHAVVIGASDYQYLPDIGGAPTPGSFGLQKLTAASKSAVEMAAWLRRHQDDLVVPVATVRLCASPTAQDLAAPESTPPIGASTASRQDIAIALNEWRSDQDPDDVSLFYFAGHGVQRDRSNMVLLCADFAAPGDGPLSRAVELTHVWDGLGRSDTSAMIARTQMYFVDACRERPAAIAKFDSLSVPDIWGILALVGKDDRRAPIYYATTPGALAYADPGVATLFSKTLIRCLDNEAATLDDNTGDWQITSKSLERALGNRFRALAGATTDQECDADHTMGEFLIGRLAKRPTCAVTLRVAPDAAFPLAAVQIRDLVTQQVLPLPFPLQMHPYDYSLPGGYYMFSADIRPPQAPYVACLPRPRLVEPSRFIGAIEFKVLP